MFEIFDSASMTATRVGIIETGLLIQQRDFFVKRPRGKHGEEAWSLLVSA
jgi:hypothetical protein